MKALVIKTSSLGDVVHMLPAITDARTCLPDLRIDWVVEEGFAEVPVWHPGVRKVIPLAIRRWRKSLFSANTRQEISHFLQTLQAEQYDIVLDSQGLLKSALVACQAHGTRHGYDRHSIREPLASFCYQQRHEVSRQQHAIARNRQLMAAALGYQLEGLPLDYGITIPSQSPPPLPENYIVALHGTSRPAKEWPEHYWQELIQDMGERGVHTLLPWGNTREQKRAKRLAQHPSAHVLPRSSLTQLAGIIHHAKAVIGMDTGLMHIAAALDQRGLALYPATAPMLTGVMGNDSTPMPITTLSGAETQDAAIIIQRLADLLES